MRSACWLVGGIGLVIIALAALGSAHVLRGGIAARARPSALEARVARALRGWAIPGEAREATNPIAPSPRVLESGLAHFADHCATCHANDGSGQTELGRSLYPRAPDLRAAETQRLTDGELFYIIENGVRLTGMPAWGGPGTAEESWHLVHFIRHLPTLTAEERASMEALNPRSPEEWRALQEEDAFLRGEEPAARPPGDGAHPHGKEHR
ncbi:MULTISPECIES: c-type cytochrome [Anaeromyxobacter]|uniref:c-type cytochrome n=1 Tax=Anaeromyxobacter TaxID=161492 RepID=UPI001F572E12|nr:MULTISPECIES: c-type cytochrome [unclassified Anaeromyxobacter]